MAVKSFCIAPFRKMELVPVKKESDDEDVEKDIKFTDREVLGQIFKVVWETLGQRF